MDGEGILGKNRSCFLIAAYYWVDSFLRTITRLVRCSYSLRFRTAFTLKRVQPGWNIERCVRVTEESVCVAKYT